MKIAIDAGHGSETAGKRTPDGYREHWANVKVANYFAQAMDRCGIAYIKTGWNDANATDDVDVSLTTRQKQIKDAKCDVSVSFHFNACGDGASYNSGEGIEVLIGNKTINDSKALAQKVHTYLIQGTKQKDRGIKAQALAMCNCAYLGTKASILIECGFMTNKREAELMQSESFCRECAEETARGVCEYLKIPYVAINSAPPKPTQPSTSVVSNEFKVRITVSSLNIRENPSASAKKVGAITDKGVYTIVETSGNWGLLKAYATKRKGWINISSAYAKRV